MSEPSFDEADPEARFRHDDRPDDEPPAMVVDGTCPCCGAEYGRDEVHNGVAMLYGPYGCGKCGWSESEEYDCRAEWKRGESKREGDGVVDPRGGWLRVRGADPVTDDPDIKF